MPSRGEDGPQDLEGPKAHSHWPARDPTIPPPDWYTKCPKIDKEWQQHTYHSVKQVINTLP